MSEPWQLVEYRDTLDALVERKEALKRERARINLGSEKGRAQWTANWDDTREVDERINVRMRELQARSLFIDLQAERASTLVADHPFFPDPIETLCTACDEPEVRHRYRQSASQLRSSTAAGGGRP